MNFSPHTFELTLVPKEYEGWRSRAYDNAEGSHRIFKTKSKNDYYDITFDEALVSDGIRIEYHDTFLKPHIRFIVNPSKVLGGEDIPKLWKPTDRNLKALLRKLKVHIKDWRDVEDGPIRRRMLRLLDLVPEKKSLHLAQKALNYRKLDRVMDMFADIEVSPVTISKRHDVKKLDNLYKFM